MELTISNLLSDNTSREIPNQFEVITSKGIYFQSYDSINAQIKNGQLTLARNWDYSNTSRKYLYVFLRKHNFGCYDTRKAVLKGIQNKEIKLSRKDSLEY